MRQILQNLKTGETELAEIPCPAPHSGELLIRTHASLVSLGTERMLVEFGKAGLIAKARQQPDKVRMVLEKIKTDGLAPTIAAVRSKLDQPMTLGYCNVGTVIDVGSGVLGFSVGERVVSNGKHAEVVAVPVNLCAKVPATVGDDQAAFTVLGAIALQGIRLAAPTLGENFVVIGLGLIGLVTVQLLRAQGCRVLGIDFDEQKLELARTFGAETVALVQGEDPVARAMAFSRGHGVDGVLITASTDSDEPIHQSAQMCRKRGRIVLVGVTGLALSRADFYEKELSFQVSCSYGPGRYDASYEEHGNDYPIGFVRWTEQRNFEAVLDLLATGAIDFSTLISHRVPIERAHEAYELFSEKGGVLGIVLEYAPQALELDSLQARTIQLASVSPVRERAKAVMGFIGAGSYSTQVLIPAFNKAGARLRTVASSGGVTARHAGRKFSFEQVTTDTQSILTDDAVTAVAVVTRHNTHAGLVCAALKAGKHVFVEKPLAINAGQLAEVEQAYRNSASRGPVPMVMVGFNRRFAPHVARMKALLAPMTEPKAFVMTVNAGAIPASHWTQDPDVGGGRIIGEGCHFIDLLRYLAGSPIVAVHAQALETDGVIQPDNVSVTLKFEGGSTGTLHYLANGHKSVPKERLSVFCGGRILDLDNFRKLRGYGWSGFRTMNLWTQDKGQEACAAAFVNAVAAGGPSPIAFEELVEVTRATFEIVQLLRS